LPSWLTLDKATGLLHGTVPAQPGTTSSNITAIRTDTEEGDLNHPFNIVVVVLPVWDSNPLNLGQAKEDLPFQFDLKLQVPDPAGSTFSFSAPVLPAWLSLNPTPGILPGPPRRVNVGDFTVAAITAITFHGTASVPAKGTVAKTIPPPKWNGNPIALP